MTAAALAEKLQLAISLHQSGQAAAARLICEEVLAMEPRSVGALMRLGIITAQASDFIRAAELFQRAVQADPQNPLACNNLGLTLQKMQRLEEALEYCERAIALKADYAEAHFNRGNVLLDLRRAPEALASYDQAIASRPRHAESHANRGVALKDLRRLDEAVASFDRAIALNQGHANYYVNRGNAFMMLQRFDDALRDFDSAMGLAPDAGLLLGTRLAIKMHLCDWRDFDANLRELTARIGRGEAACSPLAFSALCGSAALQKNLAEVWVRNVHAQGHALPPIAKYAGHEKIRIGYFSADFYDHPVSTLTAELYELHDRMSFEVTAFSFGPDTQDPMRRRLENAFDRFIDVSARTDREIVLLARRAELDIAVDLGGFTDNARPGVFALRAAPLQVSYLGYLGTTGAAYMDYLIADAVIVPHESRQHYTEKILYLPSYQANDSTRPIAGRTFSRQELGLPPGSFVFCCFNTIYKITPGIFASWMRILRRATQAVLFLCVRSETASGNLRGEALRHGVDPARLVFGPPLPPPEYLARCRAPDLFLDTLPYNAGTTASDALWAGLPVLTCAGEAFASRVAASVLTAVGLPELITVTLEEYEERAVALAQDPVPLAQMRQRLAENRLRTALFDSRAFTRNLESGYRRIHERQQLDLPPDDIRSQAAQSPTPNG